MGSHKTRTRAQGVTKRAMKDFRRRRFGEEEAEPAVSPESAPEEQSWLGPYPVMKALPTFENVTFRELRDTVWTERPLTEEEHYGYLKTRNEVKRRIQQARKLRTKRLRRQALRKTRREQHERNTLNRRARGLPSHNILRRFVGQKNNADSIWLLSEKTLGFTARKRRNVRLASNAETDPSLEADGEEDWEDSDSEEQNEDENSDRCAGSDNSKSEHRENEGMDYDDASGELIPTPRKWGKWFKVVRKDDEEDLFL